MKYKWIRQPTTKESIEKLLGKKVERLIVGQLDSSEDTPETGIEIEVDSELNRGQLEKLDMQFPRLKRKEQ